MYVEHSKIKIQRLRKNRKLMEKVTCDRLLKENENEKKWK